MFLYTSVQIVFQRNIIQLTIFSYFQCQSSNFSEILYYRLKAIVTQMNMYVRK